MVRASRNAWRRPTPRRLDALCGSQQPPAGGLRVQTMVVLRSADRRADLPHWGYPGHVCLRLGAQPRVSRSLSSSPSIPAGKASPTTDRSRPATVITGRSPTCSARSGMTSGCTSWKASPPWGSRGWATPRPRPGHLWLTSREPDRESRPRHAVDPAPGRRAGCPAGASSQGPASRPGPDYHDRRGHRPPASSSG